MNNNLDLAYIAGWFDAEGCVKGSKRVSITNTYLLMLQYLQYQYGGSISHNNGRNSTKNRYMWYVDGNNALSFLLQVTPYLIEKKPQAELFIGVRTKPSWETGVTKSGAVQLSRQLKKVVSDYKVELPMEETSLSYLAGWFDGEGCIQIVGSTLHVSITNTFHPLLSFLQEVFAGTIHDTTQPDNTKPVYMWRICANNALVFLTCITPYLREKRPQAELAIDLLTKPTWETGLSASEVDRKLRLLKKESS